ncbi:hypothetical protein VXP86_09155 [Acinetobacter oleivorans]|nr:hypothetical protein [Acinetobacter pittii]
MPHSFRHIASPLLNGCDLIERDFESALVHEKDSVAGVYDKAQYLQDYKQMIRII